MNYLAHALLSFGQEKILIGNMLGDFVKGKNYLSLPPDIQNGILLHRHIDRTTDEHPIVHEAMAVFKPTFHLSNGVFVDIFFDHFLANDSRYFTHGSLSSFTNSTYRLLDAHQHLFDERMVLFFSYMSKYNWLYHYKEVEGIEKSIRGMCKRYPRLGDAEKALEIFYSKYDLLRDFYHDFFPILMKLSKEKLEELLSV